MFKQVPSRALNKYLPKFGPRWFVMSTRLITLIIPGLLSIADPAAGAEAEIVFSGEKRLNNLAPELLVASSPPCSTKPLVFTRPRDG